MHNTILGHRTMGAYLTSRFGGKVWKIAINAGLGCPNRDGTTGVEGCIYCNNASFSPGYSLNSGGNISAQIEDGKRFFSRKGNCAGYLAYFQSFTSTYGKTDKLIGLYEEALSCEGVLGLVISTRPDCLEDELLDWMCGRFGSKAPEGHPYLLLELGVESTLDSTLERINRGHNWECARNAVLKASSIGIDVGVHLILGLPFEDMDDYLRHVREISRLPVGSVKFHQLQIIRGTSLERMYNEDPSSIHVFSAEEYAATLKILLENLREDIVVDRLVGEAPKDMLVAPGWGLKPDEFLSSYIYNE